MIFKRNFPLGVNATDIVHMDIQPQPLPVKSPKFREPSSVKNTMGVLAATSCLLLTLTGCSSPATELPIGAPSFSDNALLGIPPVPAPSVSLTPPSEVDVTQREETLKVFNSSNFTLTDARSAAETAGFSVRIISVDGESFPVTMDYNETRLNFTVVNNIVTAATIG